MLKKAGIVVAASAAGLLALSPLAFADEGGLLGLGHLLNVQNTNVQVPVQACNNSVVEGTVGVLAKKQKNSDSHDGDCKQKNSADNDADND